MKIGYQSMVINPTSPQRPVGHLLDRNNLSLTKGDMFIRCFFIEIEQPILLVTLDVFAISPIVIKKMEELAQHHFQSPIKLIASATHVHSAPSLFTGYHTFKHNPKYLSYVLERFEICLIKLRSQKIDLKIAFSCQDITLDGFYHHPLGTTRLQLLSLYDDVRPVSHWVFFNAHPTLVAKNAHYFSSDYVGAMLEKLQRQHPFETFIFFQGACLDVDVDEMQITPTYQESIKISNILVDHINKLIRSTAFIHPSSIMTRTITIPISHQTKSIRRFVATKNPQLTHFAEQLLPKIKEYEAHLPTEVDFVVFEMSQCTLIFTPFEWHSFYQQQLPSFKVLVGFSNGYYGNIDRPAPDSLTMSSFFETIRETQKTRLIDTLKKL